MLLVSKLKILLLLAVLGLLFFLQQVFSGNIILSQSFNLGFFRIHYYGLIMAVAVGAGYALATQRAKSFNISEEQVDNIIFWTCVFGFIAARLYHVFSAFEYYSTHLQDVFKVWHGGLSIYGAIFGGIFALFFVVKILNLKSSILNLLNWLTPSLILGQIIGRFGNLFNYEAFGYPTNLPWKMFVPIVFRPTNYSSFSYFHPFFLYELVGNVIILYFLLKLERDTYKKESLFIYYVLLYNILRFSLEFLRTDSTFIGIYRLNSITSGLLILLAVGYLFLRRKHDKIS